MRGVLPLFGAAWGLVGAAAAWGVRRLIGSELTERAYNDMALTMEEVAEAYQVVVHGADR